MRFLFVDRIVELVPRTYVRGLMSITSKNEFLCTDDKGVLCFMPSFIGEALGQLAAWNVMFSNDFTHRPVAGIASSAKLIRPAYVGETLLLESFIDHLDDAAVQYHSVARVGDEVIFTIDGALGPLLPMADFIEPAVVRQQFDDIHQPGDWTRDDVHHDTALTPVESKVPMLFDRVFDFDPGVRLSAEKTIRADAPYFPDHFPKKPVWPMTVLLECTLNLAREFVTRSNFDTSYKVCEVRRVKMKYFVQPGHIVLAHFSVKQHDEEQLVLTVQYDVGGRRVCVLEIVMSRDFK